MKWLWIVKRMCFLCVLTAAILSLSLQLAEQYPLSPFYRSTHSEKTMVNISKQLNNHRVKNSMTYLNSTARTAGSSLPPTSPQLVVVVITVARRHNVDGGPRYLTQTLAAMDILLTRDVYFDKTFMFVCNVDRNPSEHLEAVELERTFPYVNKNGDNNIGINVSKAANAVQHFEDPIRRQESEDYVFCLNVSYSLNSKYVLVLEDDVLPAKNALQVLSYTLKNRLQQRQYIHDSSTPRKFSYLKLYYPLKWQGFANEAERILELIAIGILGGTISSVAMIVILFRKGRENNSASTYHVVVSFLYGMGITIPLALIIGRVNIISLRHIHPQLYKLGPSPGCCTPAMLYTRDAIPGLMDYLIYNNSQAKDLGIYNYTLKQGLPAYQLEPNLFIHTGMISTLSDQSKKPDEFVYDISILH